MSEPLTVTLTIDLDAHLARHIGYDAEGEPVQEHTTVEDLVVDLVANKLVDRIVSMRGNWDGVVRERVNQVRDEVIVERVTPLIDEAMAAPVQPTNRYGEPAGDATTLRDLIVQEAKTWLHKPAQDSYGDRRRGQTNIGRLIADEVDRALTREMKTALEQAKAEVVAAVQAKGAEVLAQTIARMAGGGA